MHQSWINSKQQAWYYIDAILSRVILYILPDEYPISAPLPEYSAASVLQHTQALFASCTLFFLVLAVRNHMLSFLSFSYAMRNQYSAWTCRQASVRMSKGVCRLRFAKRNQQPPALSRDPKPLLLYTNPKTRDKYHECHISMVAAHPSRQDGEKNKKAQRLCMMNIW